MPKEIAAVIQEGLATRQGRQDIPFNSFKQLTLFAKGGLFPVFLFKAKNGDLGYAPSASGSGEMETTFNVYYQFYRNAEDGTQKPFFGGKNLTVLKTDGQGYDPEKEDWYSFGTALEIGKYTLAIVLTTPDMKKISVAYCDIALPGPEAYQTALFATEPVLLKSMDQVEPDPRPTIHRGCFYYGAAQVRAYVTDPVPQGGALDIIFYVFGAAPKDPAAERPVNDLEVNYQVQGQDGKTAVRWAPQTYDAFAINQQLPLEQTVQKIDQEKGTVLSEEKSLWPRGPTPSSFSHGQDLRLRNQSQSSIKIVDIAPRAVSPTFSSKGLLSDAGLLMGGSQGQEPFQAGYGFGHLVLADEDGPHLVIGVGIIRVKLDSLGEARQGRFRLAEVDEADSQVVLGVGVVGAQAGGLLVEGLGLGELIGLGQGLPGLLTGAVAFWVELDGLAERGQGLGGLARLLQGQPEIEMGGPIGRVEPDGLSVGGRGLRELLLGVELVALEERLLGRGIGSFRFGRGGVELDLDGLLAGHADMDFLGAGHESGFLDADHVVAGHHPDLDEVAFAVRLDLIADGRGFLGDDRHFGFFDGAPVRAEDASADLALELRPG
jgi:hypothetical protein